MSAASTSAGDVTSTYLKTTAATRGQTHQNLELILVDDHSTDGAVQALDRGMALLRSRDASPGLRARVSATGQQKRRKFQRYDPGDCPVHFLNER